MQRDIPLKKFLETLSLFSLPEFSKKGEGLPKLKSSHYVTERVSIIQSLFSWKFRRENRFRDSKNFWRNIYLYLLNILALQLQNENKKF